MSNQKLYRHLKRGTTYRILHYGVMSSTDPSIDGLPAVVYQSEEDGNIWIRTSAEFFDGRFEELKSAAVSIGAHP